MKIELEKNEAVQIMPLDALGYGCAMDDILDHIRLAYHITLIRIHLVAVDALDKHRLTVHQKLAVLDFDISEADLKHRDLSHTLTVI